ncbi:hypothetical protein AMAG_06558 [Allomyces macrogynus ATCC 38327]|uniref:Uncharacterized protein n=1 Tax=Allomyces macrogynus (strain ATCC 38327) TaxID=578462 RepID=A0A0L0SGW9_ALLM3|nr:hypothetical protein AMAG_06558 [Allomyces macrogynus ATCC 38327]|eukprot:KNE61758.1 hypothetical protein AMAG_06558 [Allomyces macrogynus ATCC 38327]
MAGTTQLCTLQLTSTLDDAREPLIVSPKDTADRRVDLGQGEERDDAVVEEDLEILPLALTSRTGRAGSADDRGGAAAKKGVAGAPAPSASPAPGAKGSAAQTGKTLAAGTAGNKGSSATDLKAKKPSTPAGGDKLAAPSAAGKRGSTMGKKMDDAPADDGEVVVADTQVVETIVVPPGVDLDVFEAHGTHYVWGNRALAYLNVANNQLSVQAVKYLLDVLADQATDDKTLVTTNVYSDPSVRDRPKHGLLRVALQGNLFPMTDPLVQQLDQRLVAKQQAHSAAVAAAAAAATATPATTSRQSSAAKK